MLCHCCLPVAVPNLSSCCAVSVLFTCCSTLPTQLLCCVSVVDLLQCPSHPVALLCQCGLPVAVPFISSCFAVSELCSCCSALPIQWPCCVSVVYLLQCPSHPVAMLCQCCLPVAVPYLSSFCAVSVLFSCCSTQPIHWPCCVSVV